MPFFFAPCLLFVNLINTIFFSSFFFFFYLFPRITLVWYGLYDRFVCFLLLKKKWYDWFDYKKKKKRRVHAFWLNINNDHNLSGINNGNAAVEDRILRNRLVKQRWRKQVHRRSYLVTDLTRKKISKRNFQGDGLIFFFLFFSLI